MLHDVGNGGRKEPKQKCRVGAVEVIHELFDVVDDGSGEESDLVSVVSDLESDEDTAAHLV